LLFFHAFRLGLPRSILWAIAVARFGLLRLFRGDAELAITVRKLTSQHGEPRPGHIQVAAGIDGVRGQG